MKARFGDLMRLTALALATTVTTTGCGVGGAESGEASTSSSTATVRVKRADLPEKELEIKTAYAINRGKEYSVRIADFDLNPQSDMISVPTDKTAVYMSLTNKDGSLPQAGQVFTFPETDGHKVYAEVYRTGSKPDLSPITKGSNKQPVGSVKVISVDDQTLVGEADLDNGEAGVKGKFTGKIVKRN